MADPRRPLGLSDIAGEALLLAGGGAAILLQLADPAVAAGVARHSDFEHRPLDRLLGTLDYVYAVVFAEPDELAFVRRRVNRAHSAVRGPADATHHSPAYDAYARDAQLWVAATLYHAAIDVWQRVRGPLDAASADRIYADFAVVGTTLQLRPEDWPADRAAFERYWADASARLRVGDDARRAVAALLTPSSAAPRWLRALMPVVRLLTAGLLPPLIRAQYALPWSRPQRICFAAALRTASVVYPLLPRRLRLAVCRQSLRRLRRERLRDAAGQGGA